MMAARRGWVPILLGRSVADLERVAQDIRQAGLSASDPVECDLSNLDSIAAASAEITREHPDLDALVHNGCTWLAGQLDTHTDAEIEFVITSALTGTIALTRCLLPFLRARPYADIHTVVSMSGLRYAPLLGASAAFMAAKAGQDGFTLGLVQELRETDVRVTATYPGLISEEMLIDDNRSATQKSLSVDDVADAVLYAISAPPHVAFRQIVIERSRSDFLRP